MELTTCQINLYIIFFLIILLITLFYSSNNLINIESYEDNNKTSSITLDNSATQNMFNGYISNLSVILNKYTNIDVPIIINNNNKICDSWGNYKNGKYKLNTNQCLIVQGQRSCLTNSNLVSCSKYYDDNINSLNKIDTNKILNYVKNKILIDYDNVNKTIIEKNKNIYGILKNLIDKRNLENQQLYFIEYNDSNLNDKKKLVNKSTDELEKAENEFNLNQLNFSIFLDQNNNNDNKTNLYYKIIIGIIISIIIMGILNFIFSELL